MALILIVTILFITCSGSVISGKNVSKVCDKTKFQCDSGQCIPEEKLCDGAVDCADGSDETKDCVNIIPCSSHFLFQCDYGACINKKFQCDGKIHCKDGSDESDTTCGKCGAKKFKCGSGECIDESFLCDGVGDCNDNSDETLKECEQTVCPDYSFRCNYGACIMKKFRCNGIVDCADGSDENSCSASPSTSPKRDGKFRCDSGEYVDEHDVCDGIGHCNDGSDETEKMCNSINCPLYTYRCKYGACVNRNARCNGIADCIDGSDEAGCNFNQEAALKPSCSKDEFKCSSGQCIKDEKVCDGRKDCDDASEETFDICAYRRCSMVSFTCGYGACVPKSAKCDGIINCYDASDERDCKTPKRNLTGCVIPSNPGFGTYQIANTKLRAGDIAPPYSVLIPKCNKGYGITPPEELVSVCIDDKWTPEPQNCTRTCPLIESTSPIECKYNNKSLKTCDKAVHGTIALVQCDTGADGVLKSVVNFCRNGLWDAPIGQCIPTTQNANTTFVNIFYIFSSEKTT